MKNFKSGIHGNNRVRTEPRQGQHPPGTYSGFTVVKFLEGVSSEAAQRSPAGSGTIYLAPDRIAKLPAEVWAEESALCRRRPRGLPAASQGPSAAAGGEAPAGGPGAAAGASRTLRAPPRPAPPVGAAAEGRGAPVGPLRRSEQATAAPSRSPHAPPSRAGAASHSPARGLAEETQAGGAGRARAGARPPPPPGLPSQREGPSPPPPARPGLGPAPHLAGAPRPRGDSRGRAARGRR